MTDARTEFQAAEKQVTQLSQELADAEALLNKARQALEALSLSQIHFVHESEAVDGIKIKSKWDEVSHPVSQVAIEKHKVTGLATDQKYLYFLAVETQPGDRTEAGDLSGTIQLRKSGSFDYDEMQLQVGLTLAHPQAESPVIPTKPAIFTEGVGFSGDAREEFTLIPPSPSAIRRRTCAFSPATVRPSTRSEPSTSPQKKIPLSIRWMRTALCIRWMPSTTNGTAPLPSVPKCWDGTLFPIFRCRSDRFSPSNPLQNVRHKRRAAHLYRPSIC